MLVDLLLMTIFGRISGETGTGRYQIVKRMPTGGRDDVDPVVSG
jgi:hypothetical protein